MSRKKTVKSVEQSETQKDLVGYILDCLFGESLDAVVERLADERIFVGRALLRFMRINYSILNELHGKELIRLFQLGRDDRMSDTVRQEWHSLLGQLVINYHHPRPKVKVIREESKHPEESVIETEEE